MGELGMSELEQERARRTKILQERLQSVTEAARSLHATVAAEQAASRPAPAQRKPRPALPIARAAEKRRSGRLAGQDAVTYNERLLCVDELDAQRRRGRGAKRADFASSWGAACARPEVYTEAHVSALGTCETPWTLFVDGYDAQTGKRVYDKESGATCHQCRQKTLGKRTACTTCRSLLGQFCGDCLHMRYGENVDEVAAAAAWACPTCRGLCNCSAHRSRAGWAPTGAMYRSAEAQGFRSVSHALVLSNLSDAARAAIVAGTLLVPGGYPEDWATVAGAPFPPLAVARAAPPPPAQASSDDGTATSESAADAPAYDEAAAPSEAEAEAAPPPPPAADAGRPVLSARRPKRGSIAELQRVVNFFAPDVAAGGRTTRGGAAIGGEAAQHATGRKRTRSMRLSDIDVPVATAVAPAATRAAPDAVALHFPTTAGKAAQAEGGAAPRWQVRKARRIAPA